MLRLSNHQAHVTTPHLLKPCSGLVQLRLRSAQACSGLTLFTRRGVAIAKANFARNHQLLVRGPKRSLSKGSQICYQNLPLYHANRYGDHNLGGHFFPCSKSGCLLSTFSPIFSLSVKMRKSRRRVVFIPILSAVLCSR
jgi:hypothetical protein